MKFQGLFFSFLSRVARFASSAWRMSVFVHALQSSLKSTFEVLCGVGSRSKVRFAYIKLGGNNQAIRLKLKIG